METIRSGRHEELEQLREIERSAGMAFLDYGMSAVSEDEPPSVEVLAEYCDDGRLWVIANDADLPVAYLIVDLVDQCAHIEQISVHADHAGKGLGRSLIEMLAVWAKEAVS